MVKLRAIDGEGLYEKIYHYTFEQSQTPKFAEICDFLAGMEKAADMIGDMPEIDVGRHDTLTVGHWEAKVAHTGFLPWKPYLLCSQCGFIWNEPRDANVFLYCPNCGSKME